MINLKSFPSFRFQPISTWTRPRLAKCIIGGKKVRALNVQKKSRFQGGRNFQPVLDYNFIGDFVDRDGDLEMKKKKKWARGGSPIVNEKHTRGENTKVFLLFSSLLFLFFARFSQKQMDSIHACLVSFEFYAKCLKFKHSCEKDLSF